MLSEKYNCLPSYTGFHYTNIDNDHTLMPNKVFRYHGENIEGLHVVGPHREWGRNFYDYAVHHNTHFCQEGRKYRPYQTEFHWLDTNIFCAIENTSNHEPVCIKLVSAYAESEVNCHLEYDDLLITTTAGFQLTLQNPQDQKIILYFAIQPILNSKLSRERFIIQKGEKERIHHINQCFYIEFEPNEEVILYSYDLDNQDAKLAWRFHRVKFI